MDPFTVASLVFTLVEKFGPAAKQIWDDWHQQVGDAPTQEQWDALKARIDAGNPDAY